MNKPYDPGDARFLTAIEALWPSAEATAFFELARLHHIVADGGYLAARLAVRPRALKPWLLEIAEACELLAEAAGAHADPIADPPGLRRLLSGAYRILAEAVADPELPLAAVLDERQLEVMLDALDDAARWRGHRAAAVCQDCADSPVELCQAHADDLDRIDRYGALFRQFEPIAVPDSFRLTGGR
jgi:hypothetical protein